MTRPNPYDRANDPSAVLRAELGNFEAQPSNRLAGRVLRLLLAAEADDMIDDDTFLDGLSVIRTYLER